MKAKAIALGILGLAGSVAAEGASGTLGGLSATLSTGALLLLGAGAFAFFGTKYKDVGKVLMALGVLSAIGILPFDIGGSGLIGSTALTQSMVDCGKSATLNLKGYDQESDTLALKSGAWYIYDAAGTQLVSGSATNSTTGVTTCLAVDIYGDDTTAVYTEPLLGYVMKAETDTVNIKTHAVATLSSMNLSVYDSNMNVLTGDDSDVNSADYMISLAAGQEKVVYMKLDTNQANRGLQLCGVAVGWNNIKELEIDDTNYEKVACFDEIIDTSVLINNDTHNNTAVDFDACYKRKNPIMLHEFDTETIKTVIKANTGSDPVLNNYSVAFVNVIDCGYALGADNRMYFDMYVHDANERASEVGAAETFSSPSGGTEGTLIEVQ